MKPRTIQDFGVDSRPHGDQLLYRCPACASRRFVALVDPSSGLWHCSRCNEGGKIDVPTNAGTLRAHAARQAEVEMSWGPAVLPPWEMLGSQAADFLTLRYGLTLPEFQVYGLVQGYEGMSHGQPMPAPYGGRILIPYVDHTGEVIYFSGRSYTGAEPKYLNMPGRHPLYSPDWAIGGESAVGKKTRDLILVEGVFDAIKVRQSTGLRVAAIGGKALPKYLMREVLKMRPGRIRVALDSDALAAALKLRAQLAPFVDAVDVVHLPPGQDPGSMGAKDLREVLS